MLHACSPSIWSTKAEGSQIQDSLGYTQAEQNAELGLGLGGGESPKHAQGTGIDPSSEKNKEEVEEEDVIEKEEERNTSENTLWTESCTVSP